MCPRVFAVVVVLLAVDAAMAQQPSCVECHTSKDALTKALGDPTKPLERLLVDKARLDRSVHKSKACDECHMDFGPYPHDNRFAVRFLYDITNKPSGKRMMMDEVGLFTVENGKIVREEFFYTTE